MPRGSARRNELILLQSNGRPSPHDPQAKVESIKIRVLVRPVNGENLSLIRGMPGRLTRDPSPKYGLSTHFFYALLLAFFCTASSWLWAARITTLHGSDLPVILLDEAPYSNSLTPVADHAPRVINVNFSPHRLAGLPPSSLAPSLASC